MKREIRTLPFKPPRARKAHALQGRLRRLPGTWCWQLFGVLVNACSTHMSSGVKAHFSQVARKRSSESYFSLDSHVGIQCIADWPFGPPPGNPAVVHMLASSFRKCRQMELFSSSQRRSQCLVKVLEVDAGIPPHRKEWETDSVYQHARDFLATLLGPLGDFRDELALTARHGPGSTATLPFGSRSRYFKYRSWPYVSSPSSRSLLTYCIQADARWVSALEDSARRRNNIPMWSIIDWTSFWDVVVPGKSPYNVVTTVPKDGRKDRPIAKEQVGNIYLQLGVGMMIRRRLRLLGIDLNHQQLRNRSAALKGSADKKSFTIDLSAASDTVGYDLVKALMPPDWFQLLDSLRAPWGVLPNGEAFLYRKFSSMGNGFTFELETILFLAICKGVSKSFGHPTDRWEVFGDDIIGPDYLYDTTRSYLCYSGFIVNSEKSFRSGQHIRESCGVDAFNGIDIRPFFVKDTPADGMELVSLRNRIRSWFLRHLGDFPVEVDSFLLNGFADLPPIGPDSDVEFDGWLHDGPWPEGIRFESWVRGIRHIPAKDFVFRKLMHTLRSCSTDGGNFIVSEPSTRIRLVDRVSLATA